MNALWQGCGGDSLSWWEEFENWEVLQARQGLVSSALPSVCQFPKGEAWYLLISFLSQTLPLPAFPEAGSRV